MRPARADSHSLPITFFATHAALVMRRKRKKRSYTSHGFSSNHFVKKPVIMQTGPQRPEPKSPSTSDSESLSEKIYSSSDTTNTKSEKHLPRHVILPYSAAILHGALRDTHLMKECTKSKKTKAKCCNCNGEHMTIYRGCPFQ